MPAGARRFQESVAPWLDAVTLTNFVRHLKADGASATLSNAPPPVKSKIMADVATTFHRRAGTLTSEVETNIDNYALGTPSVRVAHQPNFLASINVLGQAALCSRLAELVAEPVTQIFFVVDYDANTDRRYRHAFLPSLSSHTGAHSLSSPGLHRHEETFMFSEKNPGMDYISHISELIRSYSSYDLSLIRNTCGHSKINRHELHVRQRVIHDHLTAAFDIGRTLADANIIFMSRYANLVLRLPIMFIPGSEVLTATAEHIQFLWSRARDYRAACATTAAELETIGIVVSSSLVPSRGAAPFWLRCANDSSRVAMYWTDDTCASAMGICHRCKKHACISSRSIDNFLTDAPQPTLIPRVVWDDLLDGFAWGHFAGCSYRGGLEHYIFASAVARKMGLQPLPEFISECERIIGPYDDFEHAARQLSKAQTGRHPGATKAGEWASSGRATLVHSMLWRPSLNVMDLTVAFEQDPNNG